MLADGTEQKYFGRGWEDNLNDKKKTLKVQKIFTSYTLSQICRRGVPLKFPECSRHRELYTQ